MIAKHWKKLFIFFIVSVLLEMLAFNGRALFSLHAANQRPDFVQEGNTVYVNGMTGEPHYLYVGVSSYVDGKEQVPVNVSIKITDEGNSGYYDLEQVTLYPPVEKSKYLAVHSYGDVRGMQIVLSAAAPADIQVTDIVYDARVPWFISVPRMLAVFGGICLIWAVLRPKACIYKRQWKAWERRMAVAIALVLNSLFFLVLVKSNPAFLEPVWPYHYQYHQLAVSLSQGKVSIDAGNENIRAALEAMENPYDSRLRMQTVPDAGNVWDICYYQGDFYVYFGVVPVLLFYLPCYLLFHTAFPTWLGVFIASVGVLGGFFYLVNKIHRRWFPAVPYMYCLLISLVGGNSLNMACALLHADFYCLPILTALCFALWGMGLILSAAESWNQGKHVKWKIAAGGLCMALTAGCRPQFLVGSFLLIPVLWPLFWKNRKSRETLFRLAALVLPYIIVAAGLMFYNYIRFGSVFDFGANYNLTTNDMTRRGINLGRVPDGIFMYLFQPLSMRLEFPFAEVTPFYSGYLGDTIRDWTFGGAFWTRPVLLAVFCIAAVKQELRQKKLRGFTFLCLGMALVVVVADTEMAGILNRYFMDFLWLLCMAAAVVLFQMAEKYGNGSGGKWLLCFILFAGIWGIEYELGMAFRGSGIMNDNVHRYYMIKSFFQ